MAVKKAETLFSDIIEEIENGKSLVDACKSCGLDKSNFYRLLAEDEEKCEEERKKYRDIYARACEERDTKEFEEIKKIADGEELVDGEGVAIKDTSERIARDRLRIDARKWRVSKTRPSKYGDKLDLDVTSGGEKVSISLNLGLDEEEKPKAKGESKNKKKNK